MELVMGFKLVGKRNDLELGYAIDGVYYKTEIGMFHCSDADDVKERDIVCVKRDELKRHEIECRQ